MANNTSADFYRIISLILTNHEGKEISIKDIFSKIEYTEDIYQNFMYGSIDVVEAVDLQQFFPLIGEEKLKIVYTNDETKRKSVELNFRIYKVQSSNNEQERIIHKLYFVSPEAFTSANSSISKSWKAKSPKTIVNDVFSSISSKRISIGDFTGKHHIVSPNWSPMQLLNYVASISQPKNYNGSLVLFYESSKGFFFKHIEELITSASVGTWKVGLSKTEKDGESINPHNYIQSYNIIKNSIDNLDAVFSGVYSNFSLSYDNVSKTYKGYKFDYSKEYKNTKHLNDFPLNSKNSTDTSFQQKILYLPSNNHRNLNPYYISKSDVVGVSDNKEVISSWRTSLLSQISAKQIELEIIGDELIYAGVVMNIEFPSISQTDIGTHRYNTKKVLVTRINHTLTTKEHKKMVLVSDDSYSDDLSSKGFK